MRLSRAAVALLVIGFAAGCAADPEGGSTGKTGAPPEADSSSPAVTIESPCDLLEPEEVSEVVGGEVTPEEKKNDIGQDSCVWNFGDNQWISGDWQPMKGTATDPEQVWEMYGPTEVAEEVDGLGEKAGFAETTVPDYEKLQILFDTGDDLAIATLEGELDREKMTTLGKAVAEGF